MGKVKKGRSSRGLRGDPISKPPPLAQQLLSQSGAENINERPNEENIEDRNANEGETIVSPTLTAKILKSARKQEEEIKEELGISSRSQPSLDKSKKSDNQNVDYDDDNQDDDDAIASDDDGDYGEEIQIDEDEEKALEMFMNPKSSIRNTLGEVIRGKVEKDPTLPALDPRLVEMYCGVKKVLASYRSGRLPKAFKILPTLTGWDQLLELTDPGGWSAAAMYQATRIFSSNLNPNMAQRFYNLVLLPRIRDDIAEYKRLNYHLYAALKKALFKPSAWFKGILLPLCETGSCTLREALIIGSVLSRNTVPILESSACLLKLCEMDYTGSNSIFIRILLDKRYALPYRVVDALVHHFVRFYHDDRALPVLWHQCLLSLCQHYKLDMSEEQKDAVREVTHIHRHRLITPEIHRELQHQQHHPQ